jgi:hypothetical protein
LHGKNEWGSGWAGLWVMPGFRRKAGLGIGNLFIVLQIYLNSKPIQILNGSYSQNKIQKHTSIKIKYVVT